MGIITEQSRRNFWRPAGGFLWHNCKETDPGAEPYTPTKGDNAGKTTYRQKGFGYTGIIDSVQIKGGPFGLNLNIGFDNTDVLSVKCQGGYLLAFAQICRQIDLSKPVTCTPYSFQDEKSDRQITGWSWKQNGVKLVKPPGLDPGNKTTCIIPEPEEAMLANGKPLLKDGKKVLDWTARENWLMDHIMEWATDNLLALDEQGKRIAPEETKSNGIVAKPATAPEPDYNAPPEDDDVPF